VLCHHLWGQEAVRRRGLLGWTMHSLQKGRCSWRQVEHTAADLLWVVVSAACLHCHHLLGQEAVRRRGPPQCAQLPEVHFTLTAGCLRCQWVTYLGHCHSQRPVCRSQVSRGQNS
jgi:hypothetical protein